MSGAEEHEPEDPVLIFSDVLEKVVLRAQSWPDAVEVLRRNIRALADAERTFGRAMKKLASTAAPVSFVGVEKGEGTSKSPKGEVDTLVAATNLCFSACPQQLGVQHEATADAFMAVHNGKGGQLERIAKKNRGSIEAAAQGLWEGVVKAREGLAKAKKNKDALVAGAAPGGKMADDRWLVDVQLSHWRIEEREASTIYCTQVLKLAEDAHKAELECVAVLQEVLAAFMQAQCASASKIDVDLEAVARGLKLLDGEEDWKSFQSLKTIEMVRSRQISTEWKEWNVEATHQALCEGTRGDVMAGEGVEGVEKAGWLHRQGTLLSFNWHKQWFVITKYGHLHYFASKESTVPEESFQLKDFNVNLQMKTEDVLTVGLTAKSTSWFGGAATKKFNLSGDDLLEWMSHLSKYTTETFTGVRRGSRIIVE